MTDDSDTKRTGSDAYGLRALLILIGLGLGAWSTYVMIEWLVSDWPLVAVSPAMFAALFFGSAHGAWKHGLPGMSVAVLRSIAAVAVIGVALLYFADFQTGDEVYAENARTMAIWGSLPVLVALLTFLPKARRQENPARPPSEPD